jgi:hypothetical protein
MFGEDMDDEKFSQLGRGDSIMSWNEKSLLSETVYHCYDFDTERVSTVK